MFVKQVESFIGLIVNNCIWRRYFPNSESRSVLCSIISTDQGSRALRRLNESVASKRKTAVPLKTIQSASAFIKRICLQTKNTATCTSANLLLFIRYSIFLTSKSRVAFALSKKTKMPITAKYHTTWALFLGKFCLFSEAIFFATIWTDWLGLLIPGCKWMRYNLRQCNEDTQIKSICLGANQPITLAN